MANRIGQIIGNYKIVSLIGEGGFAAVYAGEHLYLKDSYAAIKILHNVNFKLQFDQEAQALRELNHANIIGLRDYGFTAQGEPYILMRYAPDRSLRHQHPSNQQVEPGLIARYLTHIAKGLQFAHDRKVVHRDIKPENLLLLQDGTIAVGDFGLASTISFSKGSWVGTPPYTAPEQVEGNEGPLSDQYSLGVVAYEWLTGRLPFDGQTLEQIALQHQKPATPIRRLAPHIDAGIASVVERAISYRPEDRFNSITEFADAFLQAFYAAETRSRYIEAETVLVRIPGRHDPAQPSSTSLYSWRERATGKLTESGSLETVAPAQRQLDYMAIAVVAQALLVIIALVMLVPHNTVGAICLFAVEACGLAAWVIYRIRRQRKAA